MWILNRIDYTIQPGVGAYVVQLYCSASAGLVPTAQVVVATTLLIGLDIYNYYTIVIHSVIAVVTYYASFLQAIWRVSATVRLVQEWSVGECFCN